MPAPNFEQIQSFNNVKDQLAQAAIDEFLGEISQGMSYEAIIDVAVTVAEKFAFLGAELGAQWYDLCTQLAGVDAEPAELHQSDQETLKAKAETTVSRSQESFAKTFEYYMQNVINDSVRLTGDENLWRDYNRGMAPGKWARVPVGETCAWCLMLASQGAWYLTKESALGDGNHYHNGCNCVAVYHADAESISGYSGQLGRYKAMYYDAENIRLANELGKKKYSEELQQRIDTARAVHEAKYEAGETDKPWTQYNEDLIIMRDKYGLK